jgi:hypothetical protein
MLRESKKLCERGGVLSLMKAAGGGATNAVVGADPAMGSALAEDSTGFISVAAGADSMAAGATAMAGAVLVLDIGEASGSVTATRAFAAGAADAVVEDAFAEAAFAIEDASAEDEFAVEVEAAESDAEAGVDVGAGRPRPSAALADGPNNAKNMAATATLTSSPPDVS